jgi:hypothetical protein
VRSFLRTFLVTSIPAGIFWGFYFGGNFSSAARSGAVAGVIIGLAAAIIARYRENRVSDSPPILNGEVLLRKGRANYLGIVGWLYLTDQRVFFEGYPADETSPEISTLLDDNAAGSEPRDISIPVHEISEAVISRRLGVPRLEIILNDGRTEHFQADELAGWVEEISTARRNYLDQPRSENSRLFQ